MCLRVCDLYCMFVRFVLCGNNDREDSRQNRGEFRETKGLDMLSKWSAGEGEEDKTDRKKLITFHLNVYLIWKLWGEI